ncbi:Uncharacterised protein [Mycobacteroides abscessus subsp. abscessus]|nr:Uncharacterised protein [Mycobacteroides abscessus subsp. abscessus]SKU34921.1 Uncharacterised protein [Mycobacteroides abscessus subsp. abscessus]
MKTSGQQRGLDATAAVRCGGCRAVELGHSVEQAHARTPGDGAVAQCDIPLFAFHRRQRTDRAGKHLAGKRFV